MNFTLRGFNSPIPDNDLNYFILLEGAINSVAPDSIGIIQRNPEYYLCRISLPSTELVDTTISSINALNTYVNILLKYSKSVKKNGMISFNIPIFVEQK